VVALDRSHLAALRRLAPDAETAGRIRLLRSFDPAVGPLAEREPSRGARSSVRRAEALAATPAAELDVPDPYYDGPDEFERCLDMVEKACHGLLDFVAAELDDA
jgi:protein-tyrosine phosphatase